MSHSTGNPVPKLHNSRFTRYAVQNPSHSQRPILTADESREERERRQGLVEDLRLVKGRHDEL